MAKSTKKKTSTKQAAEKATNAHLDLILVALSDLGTNRLPYGHTSQIHEKKKAALVAHTNREEVKKNLITPYIPEGRDPSKGVNANDEGFPELVAAIEELYAQEVDLGDPIDLTTLPFAKKEALEINTTTLDVLSTFGLLILGKD